MYCLSSSPIISIEWYLIVSLISINFLLSTELELLLIESEPIMSVSTLSKNLREVELHHY